MNSVLMGINVTDILKNENVNTNITCNIDNKYALAYGIVRTMCRTGIVVFCAYLCYDLKKNRYKTTD